MTQWEKYLDLYLKHKKASKLSERTIADANYHVTNLFKGHDDIDFNDFRALKRLITEYFANSDNINSVTFNTRRKNLNTFFNWLVEEEYIEKSPTTGIKKAKEDRKPRHVSSEIIIKLLEACDRTTYVGLRDYIFISLSVDTGIRPSEAEQLLFSDFNLSAYQYTIRAEISKTRISRTLPLNKKLVPLIQNLYNMRQEQNWPDSISIFANWNGEPLTRWSWRRRLIHYSKKLEIKVTPYMLRHTAAIETLRNGGNAFHVQTMMGHTNMNTTKIYVNLLESDLSEVHKMTSPLDKMLQNK